ncbi:hypothetical protein L6164_008102 [Bauhinia variegata]|uniref:Uncharacterized protein n=1 Tax=Bauhinia variegata TaxID=167791 RepID=A0ACB9PFF0_BAUVA|nr:hypothetical protein L6164_008102 [Bauhinia variegata]
MNSSSLFSFFLVFSSFLYLGFSDQSAGGGGGPSSECMQKLTPCKDSLKSTTEPPEECCLPLEEVLDTDPSCTCAFFHDANTLKTLGVTPAQAMKLPENCNLQFDDSLCKPDEQNPAGLSTGSGSTLPSTGSNSTSPPSTTASAPSPTSTVSGSPPEVTVTDVPTTSSPPTPSAEQSAATKISHFGAASLIALVFAAY